MKQKDLIKRFKQAGWTFKRHGGKHDIYEKDNQEEQIPRHKEINEILAKALIKKWGL